MSEPRTSATFLVAAIVSIVSSVALGPLAHALYDAREWAWFVRLLLVGIGMWFSLALWIGGVLEIGGRAARIAAACFVLSLPTGLVEVWAFLRSDPMVAELRVWTPYVYLALGLVAAVALVAMAGPRDRRLACLLVAIQPLVHPIPPLRDAIEAAVGELAASVIGAVVEIVAAIAWLVVLRGAPCVPMSVDRPDRLRTVARVAAVVVTVLALSTAAHAFAVVGETHVVARGWSHVAPLALFAATFALGFALAHAAARPTAGVPHLRLALAATAIGAGVGIDLAHAVVVHTHVPRGVMLLQADNVIAHVALAAGLALVASACAAFGVSRRLATVVALASTTAIAVSAVLRDSLWRSVPGGEGGLAEVLTIVGVALAQASALAAIALLVARTARHLRDVRVRAAADVFD